MNSMKRQKDRTVKGELPRAVDAHYVTGISELTPERMKRGSQSKTVPSCGCNR